MDYNQVNLNAPASIWHVMFNVTKMELELTPGPGMYIFFEKDTRGGVSYISNRYSKASKKYFKSYDPKQESKYIIHLHGSNLCGQAMPKVFQTSGFKYE